MNRGAGPIIAALSNGSVDVSVQSPPVLAAANERGSDLRFFCGTAARINGTILALPSSDVSRATPETWRQAVQSWRGKTIGVPALTGAVADMVTALVSNAGLSHGDVHLVPVGIGEGAVTALTQRNIDLLFSVPFYTQQWLDRAHVVFDCSSDAPAEMSNVMQGGWMASRQWLDKNPDIAKRFCDVLGKAIGAMFDKKDVTKAVLQKEFGLQGGALEAAMDKQGPLRLQDTNISCPALDAALRSAANAGLINDSHTCHNTLWSGRQ